MVWVAGWGPLWIRFACPVNPMGVQSDWDLRSLESWFGIGADELAFGPNGHG